MSHPVRRAILSTFTSLVILGPTAADGSTFDGRPKLLLHRQGTVPVEKNPNAGCEAFAITTCQEVVTEGSVGSPGAGPFYFVYLMLARGTVPNMSSAQVGIRYQSGNLAGQTDGVGIDIVSWRACTQLDLQSPAIPGVTAGWPGPISGNLLVWDTPSDCQTGDVATLGYFYCGAYSPDILQVIPRPVDNLAKMATCAFMEHTMSATDLGWFTFSNSGGVGCNPCNMICEVLPVTNTTWSRVKSIRMN